MAATPSRRAPRSGEPADQIDAHCPQRAVVQSWPPSLPVVWMFANSSLAQNQGDWRCADLPVGLLQMHQVQAVCC